MLTKDSELFCMDSLKDGISSGMMAFVVILDASNWNMFRKSRPEYKSNCKFHNEKFHF